MARSFRDLTPYQTLIQNLNKHSADTAISVSTELLNYWQQERKDPGKYIRYENTISILNHELENLNQTQIFLLTEQVWTQKCVVQKASVDVNI